MWSFQTICLFMKLILYTVSYKISYCTSFQHKIDFQCTSRVHPIAPPRAEIHIYIQTLVFPLLIIQIYTTYNLIVFQFRLTNWLAPLDQLVSGAYQIMQVLCEVCSTVRTYVKFYAKSISSQGFNRILTKFGIHAPNTIGHKMLDQNFDFLLLTDFRGVQSKKYVILGHFQRFLACHSVGFISEKLIFSEMIYLSIFHLLAKTEFQNLEFGRFWRALKFQNFGSKFFLHFFVFLA